MYIHGIDCDVEKFIHNADCKIAKLIECENLNYAQHCEFTHAGLKELHLLLEDRKHLITWKDGAEAMSNPKSMVEPGNPY